MTVEIAKKILSENLSFISSTKFQEATKIILSALDNAEKKIAMLENFPSNISDLPREIWKDVVGYEGKYKVSNKGRVKTFQRKVTKILIPQNHFQYFAVGLNKFGKQKRIGVHVLVAKAFIPNPENKPEVNHIDGNKRNNCVENLEWVTGSENTKHAFDTGLAKALRGVENGAAKFTAEQIKEIRSTYKKGDKNFGTYGLAKKFNVGHNTITRIINRETYQDVD